VSGAPFEVLRERLTAALARPDLAFVASGLAGRIRFQVGAAALDLVLADSGLTVAPAEDDARVVIAADDTAWETALASPPPPLFHSFAAIQLRNPAFTVSGDPLAIAQARALLEAVFEALQGAPRAASRRWRRSSIIGAYAALRGPGGDTAEIFYESAGQGPPLLCLHTAGADSRQFHGVLGDLEITASWRTIAFDMPFHGRSSPPESWDGGRYRLDQDTYRDWCAAFIAEVVREPVVVMGCSMGAGIALVLAADRPDLVRAVVGLEAPVRPRGRRNPYLTHAQVHGGWHSSAYVRGLLAPQSPAADRRQAAWIYSQGAPGIYDGDLIFYSDEFDGETVARRIDGTRIPVELLIGHYDFSATVDDARALAGWIPEAKVTEMPDLGHFPMTEHPERFRDYLLPALARIRDRIG